MTSIFYSGLSKDLSSILYVADDYNVIIEVGENNNTREFKAHSVILRARSQYFKSALSSKWITKKNDMIIFSKPNITSTVFDIILRYIYIGELDLGKHLGEDIFGLLVASDELLFKEIFDHVQNYLVKNHPNWIRENLDLVVNTVFEIEDCDKLRNFCLNTISANPQPFFTSEDFLSLDKDILYHLLDRDDLQIDEIDVWECLIKWGIEQTPGLTNSDRTKWNDENYEALKKTLNEFIPLIRFVDFSPTEYFDKIQQYKAIIPNDIYEETEEFYVKGTLPKIITLPPRDRIETNIIKPCQISTIINWIDRKDDDFIREYNDSLYKFDLIYRGSRDGINTESFRNRCNLEETILVLIKCQDSHKIFGGYTPVGFYRYVEGADYYHTKYIFSKDSFVFSIDDDTQDMKLFRVQEDFYGYAIVNNFYIHYYGFNFGDTLSMVNNGLSISSSINVYNINPLISYYEIEEIEAFKVVKRKNEAI